MSMDAGQNFKTRKFLVFNLHWRWANRGESCMRDM